MKKLLSGVGLELGNIRCISMTLNIRLTGWTFGLTNLIIKTRKPNILTLKNKNLTKKLLCKSQ